MFSGIVETVGKIKKIEHQGQGFLFYIEMEKLIKKLKLGSSVCVQGVCLTVRAKSGRVVEFEVMPETLRKTVLKDKKVGALVNLELSLKVGQELGGHFVYGHVDEVGKVTKIVKEGTNILIYLKIDKPWQKYLAAECSVTVDGVSLTVARIKGNIFAISLIEYTMTNTTLGNLKVGDEVNVEFDMIAKYLEKFTSNKQSKYSK